MRKRYGASQKQSCPFCERQATTKNSAGVPTCTRHNKRSLPPMKCACGNYLDAKTGKWGLYFRCEDCGNMNKNRAFSLNADAFKQETAKKPENAASTNKEEVVEPDDPRYFS